MNVNQLVRQLLDRGTKQEDLADSLGVSQATVSRWLKGQKPSGDVRDRIVALAKTQGVRVTSEVTTPIPQEKGLTEKAAGTGTLVPDNLSYDRGLTILPRPDHGDLVPVLGSGAAGLDGSFEFNGSIVDRIQRPPPLQNAPNGYAVYVSGESMVPRYEPGEVLFVHPGRPVTIGSYVLVQVRNPNGPIPLAFIKKLVRRTAKTLCLEQFNPPKSVDIPASDVITIHRVVGSGDS